jgi:hypothetical protein
VFHDLSAIARVRKATFYRDLKADPDLERLFRFSPRVLARELEACGGNMTRLAKAPQVPEALFGPTPREGLRLSILNRRSGQSKRAAGPRLNRLGAPWFSCDS